MNPTIATLSTKTRSQGDLDLQFPASWRSCGWSATSPSLQKSSYNTTCDVGSYRLTTRASPSSTQSARKAMRNLSGNRTPTRRAPVIVSKIQMASRPRPMTEGMLTLRPSGLNMGRVRSVPGRDSSHRTSRSSKSINRTCPPPGQLQMQCTLTSRNRAPGPWDTRGVG